MKEAVLNKMNPKRKKNPGSRIAESVHRDTLFPGCRKSGLEYKRRSANFWTDAPNTLVAILSGNIALLQAFEKERQMEERGMKKKNLGWKEEFAPL